VSGNSLNRFTETKDGNAAIGPVAIVGVGNMGGAIARALLESRGPESLVLIDPEPPNDTAARMAMFGTPVLAGPGDLGDIEPATILLAVKPQIMATVAPQYRRFAGRALFVSLAAGTTLQNLDIWLDQPTALVRCMPNLPASIGRGMTAGIARAGTPPDARHAAEALMRTVGDFVWLEREDQIDAVTAVSGSGPAYVFHLVECLAAAARDQGLSPQVADLIARRTVEGAGALLAASNQSATDLRCAVTSKGGTTEAALDILMQEKRNEALLIEAVAAATRRARELAGKP
jgi:pyrroline-5-carboxylate reductase